MKMSPDNDFFFSIAKVLEYISVSLFRAPYIVILVIIREKLTIYDYWHFFSCSNEIITDLSSQICDLMTVATTIASVGTNCTNSCEKKSKNHSNRKPR